MQTQVSFEERIADENKTSLAPSFICFVREIALANNTTVDDIYSKWLEYSRDCKNYDQSPVLGEFCRWYKLIDTGLFENRN